MAYILIRAEEHRIGDLHYHLETDLGGQKKIFMKFVEKLPELLPSGFHITYYSSDDDIGILDERDRQHMHIYYIQRRFPHNLHINFIRPAFKETFTAILQQCFPRTKITWQELDEGS